eukprot:11082719-Alexandrium_andersonii.AAC.1
MPGPGRAGARAGQTPFAASAVCGSTVSTSARGPARARPWTWRPSRRGTACGNPRRAATCWASAPK